MNASRQRDLSKKIPIPPEVSIASALNDAEKALAVLFTMLKKAAPQGAMVADEIRANVIAAQKQLKTLVLSRCNSFSDDPDAPGNCLGCGDAREAHESRPFYTKAEAEALCAMAVAGVKKAFDLCEDCPPLYWTTDKTRCKSCPRTAVKRKPAEKNAEHPRLVSRIVKTTDPLALDDLKRLWPKGCAAPDGYVDWHNWAEAQDAHGLKQTRCKQCRLYFFPQEAPEHVGCAS
jgi:hypothetical protein